ncbi:MAG: NTP transferase domain-containing protein [bacterium]|nr:NTP transferase domain-containing protein [bacterium]
MSRPLAVICLAAGLGTRTKLSRPKVLLPLCGRSLAATALAAVAPLRPDHVLVVVHHQKDKVESEIRKAIGDTLAGLQFVDQGKPRGTGHAVAVGMAALADFDGDVLVTYGDCPLIRPETLAELQRLRAAGNDGAGAGCSLLTGFPEDPAGYGRILRAANGTFHGIREHRDCSPAEAAIDEINAGMYCFDAAALRAALERLTPDNDQGELYLTDAAMWLASSSDVPGGGDVPTLAVDDFAEVQGVNTLADLAMARIEMQERILLEHLDNGVLITDPGSTWIDHDVEIGADTTILPCTVITAGCRIGSHCSIGPFSHLRTGTVVGDGCRVGNFVETKNARLHDGAKAGHLTYLGDAEVGARSNIGAGTITANYDGVNKHKTAIGEDCFVGSGSVIVAPSTMARGAMTGAGAIVRRGSELGEDEVWVGVPARHLKQREKGGGVE